MKKSAFLPTAPPTAPPQQSRSGAAAEARASGARAACAVEEKAVRTGAVRAGQVGREAQHGAVPTQARAPAGEEHEEVSREPHIRRDVIRRLHKRLHEDERAGADEEGRAHPDVDRQVPPLLVERLHPARLDAEEHAVVDAARHTAHPKVVKVHQRAHLARDEQRRADGHHHDVVEPVDPLQVLEEEHCQRQPRTQAAAHQRACARGQRPGGRQGRAWQGPARPGRIAQLGGSARPVPW